MRLLVCGGRRFGEHPDQRQQLYDALDRLAPTVLIEGGASGADARAREWARWRKVPNETYGAEWRRYGKAAGPIRNRLMLRLGKPDKVLAAWGGRGTADMIQAATDAGIPVVRLSDRETASRE